MSHFNVSNLKIENLTNFIMLFPFLIFISYYYHFFMINKVSWHSYAKGLIRFLNQFYEGDIVVDYQKNK